MKKLLLVLLVVYATGSSLTGQDKKSSFKTVFRESSSFQFLMLHSAVFPYNMNTTLESTENYYKPLVYRSQGLSLAYHFAYSNKSNFNTYFGVGLNYCRNYFSIPVAPDPRWTELPHLINQTPDKTLFDVAHFKSNDLSLMLYSGLELWLKGGRIGFYFGVGLEKFRNKLKNPSYQNQFTHSDTLTVIHEAKIMDIYPFKPGCRGGAFIKLNDQFMLQMGLQYSLDWSDYIINQTNHYYTIDGNGDPQFRETSMQGTRIQFQETQMPVNITLGLRYQIPSITKKNR